MKRKTVSLRLSVGDYARFLLECEKEDKEFSTLVRERMFKGVAASDNKDLLDLKKKLEKAQAENKSLLEDKKILEASQKKIGRSLSSKDGLITRVNNEKNAALKEKDAEIKGLKKRIDSINKATLKEGAKLINTSSELTKEIKKLKANLSQTKKALTTQENKSKNLSSKVANLEKDNKTLTSRINAANKFLKNEGMGEGFFGMGETTQF